MAEPVPTEKKELKKLREINEELENYFRNTIIPQLFVDADLILRKFSPPANMHFSLMPADIGKPIFQIPSLSKLPVLLDSIIEVIENNQDLEKEIQTPDKRWFQVNILPYIIKKGNITNGVVITFVDITGHIKDKKDIERIIGDHETFIYSVSHDFRGPLNNMIALIEMLKSALSENDKDDADILVEKIQGLTQSLKTLIGELTEITKIETNPNEPPAFVDIQKLLQEVRFTLKDQIYSSKAKIVTDFAVSKLTFPKKNLRSILYNLLSNAIKFSAPDTIPQILVKTEKSGDFTLLSVKDSGVGIEKEKQRDIFVKFTRLRPQIEGTGIGLFIISKMISSYGGKIEVKSEVGKGTTFKIYIKS